MSLAPTPQAPPAACTTAHAVEAGALKPVMDVRARLDREREITARIRALTTELAALYADDARDLTDAAGFVDSRIAVLEYAERTGDYTVTLDTAPKTAKQIAKAVKNAIGVLVDSRKRRMHDEARAVLRDLFETHGDRLFVNPIAHEVGVKCSLQLKGEYDRWSASR